MGVVDVNCVSSNWGRNLFCPSAKKKTGSERVASLVRAPNLFACADISQLKDTLNLALSKAQKGLYVSQV